MKYENRDCKKQITKTNLKYPIPNLKMETSLRSFAWSLRSFAYKPHKQITKYKSQNPKSQNFFATFTYGIRRHRCVKNRYHRVIQSFAQSNTEDKKKHFPKFVALPLGRHKCGEKLGKSQISSNKLQS
jgi:hypothetical protein